MHHRYMHAQCLLDTVVYAAYGCRTLVLVGPKLGLFALLSFPLFVFLCLFVDCVLPLLLTYWRILE